MKKFLLALVVLLSLPAVFALQATTPTLGSATTENGQAVTATFTLTNDGAEVVSDIQVSTTASSQFQVAFANVPSSLGPNASAVITVQGFIPSGFAGRQKIGDIAITGTVTSDNPFGSHNFTPDEQSPQQVSLPVELSARNDCGQDSPGSEMPVIGQWHVGACNEMNEIKIEPSVEINAGWLRVHSEHASEFWIKPVSLDCGGSAQTPPNWMFGGKIHSGPGVCDGNPEVVGGDSGWVGFYAKPSGPGRVLLTIAEDLCGSEEEGVPANGVVLGTVRTGPGACDGDAEATSYLNTSIDSGWMNIVFVPGIPEPEQPEEPEPQSTTGVFEELNESGLSGWAYDADTPVSTVHIFKDGQFWKELEAGEDRQDLVDEGVIPEAHHGFSYTFTEEDVQELNDGEAHAFEAFLIEVPEGVAVALEGSPKVLGGSQPDGDNQDDASDDQDETSDDDGQDSSDEQDGGQGASTTDVSVTVGLFMEAKDNPIGDKLAFDRVRITCKADGGTVDDGETFDVEAGDQCELEVRVENRHNSTIEDIEIEARADDSDVEEDDASISRLNVGDEEEELLVLDVEEDADDGRVAITLVVEGMDEDGVTHRDELKFTLDVEREEHDVRIADVSVSPSEAERCFDTRIDVTVDVDNRGQRDEDEVAVELSVPALKFNERERDVVLDENEQRQVRFSIPVDRSSPFGSFIGSVDVYRNDIVLSDSRSVQVKVERCSEPAAADAGLPEGGLTSEELIAQTQATLSKSEELLAEQESEKAETKFTETPLYTALLIVGVLLALTLVGLMAYGLVKELREDKAHQNYRPPKEPPKEFYY